MATSSRLPAWFGSPEHYAGSGGAAVGLLLALLVPTGGWAPAVVGGLYGAGAVLGWVFRKTPRTPKAPSTPKTKMAPKPSKGDRRAELELELARHEDRVAQSGWPEPDARTARELLAAVRARLTAPDRGAQLGQLVEEVVPAELDDYERGASWWRLEPQGPPPGVRFAERVRLVLAELP